MRRPALELRIGTGTSANATGSAKSYLVDENNTTTTGNQRILSANEQSGVSSSSSSSIHQHHSRRSFSSSSSSCSTSRSMRAIADNATIARNIFETKHASSSSAAASEHASHHHHEAVTAASGDRLSASSQSSSLSSSCQRHFRTTSSLILSAPQERSSISRQQITENSPLVSSANVRSLWQEIGSEFAELENALSSSVGVNISPTSSQQSHLSNFKQSTQGPLRCLRTVRACAIPVQPSRAILAIDYEPGQERSSATESLSNSASKINELRSSYDDLVAKRSSHSSSSPRTTGDKIRELLNKAEGYARSTGKASGNLSQIHSVDSTDGTVTVGNHVGDRSSGLRATNPLSSEQLACQKSSSSPRERQQDAMNESIEKIDQRMSELCKKLRDCLGNDTETIELLNIMIQTIEKAWSVPVCGDDLGFRLCNSLRAAGGLDVILGFIQNEETEPETIIEHEFADDKLEGVKQRLEKQSSAQLKNNRSANPLRLNLSRINSSLSPESSPLQLDQDPAPSSAPVKASPSEQRESAGAKTAPQVVSASKDTDSDILTSDLGLDSTSIESLSFVSTSEKQPGEDGRADCDEKTAESSLNNGTEEAGRESKQPDREISEKGANEQRRLAEKDELVYLCARLLSQCLTSENRNYLVEYGLNSVIRLACRYTTMKSVQSHRLLTRSRLVSRQASSVGATIIAGAKNSSASLNELEVASASPDKEQLSSKDLVASVEEEEEQQQQQQDREDVVGGPASGQQADESDMHATIGAEILQHLFKHSEETCSSIIGLGGLQAVLYACRSANLDTLRHCASALANLALYGGPDSQQTMIEQQAHVWLFPLAFNKDDNVQYYACLAIVMLAANQEIEADVLKSGTLNLVEPFVTSHEPRRFAESTTAHIHGQSASWLRRLVPLLKSKREVARNLACFHFAMEAYIKREQAQTALFREIEAIEPLRKCGGSPIAIESKFACQALRLIGEQEPHKLSQQVPLWTNEDVVEWLKQINFERFREAFVESCVDGDLLLQLNDEMLSSDIGITNGIIRRRFLRELATLKRIADYSSIDKSNLSGALSVGQRGYDFSQYIYPLIQLGVTRDNIHLLDGDQLLHECQISNTVHRLKLAQVIKELQDNNALVGNSSECSSYDGILGSKKTLDVFVSYRRATGSQLASLLKVHLQLRGFSVFIDVERLEAGKFDNNLLDSIKSAKNFILVLSPNALDRCIGDQECKDWVHKEIVAALASKCNIIPIFSDNFHWPEAEQLPEDMRSISYFNGIRWIHDYQDACVDKVERFIRGEIYNTASSSLTTTAGVVSASSQRLAGPSMTTPSLIATPSSYGGASRGVTPFEGDHHPLACYSVSSNQYLHQQQHQSFIPSSPIRPH